MITKLGRVGVIVLVIFGMLVIGGRTVLAANAGVTSIPSVQTVAAGANFSVDISVTTSTPTRGMQFALTWDPTKVKCNSVQEGTFYKGFAQQNSSITEVVLPSSPTANNTAGTFPSSGYVGIALMGGFDNATGTAPGPTGTGNVFILNMTALSASGTTTFTLSSVQLSDNNDPANNLNPTITNGQVTISAATSTTTTPTSTTTTSTKTTTTMTVTSTTATPAPSTTMPTSTTTTTTTTTATRNSTMPSSASQNIITTTKSLTSGANTELSLGTVTSLDISGSMDTSGILHADFLQGNIRYSGNNQIVSLDIPSGTRIVTSDGTPVQTITIQPGNNVPSPPANQNIVSVVQFGPSGTTFSSPMTVVYGYDPTEVPHTSNASSLALECFNNQTNQWVKCDYSVDIQNHEITAIISHFSLYAVMLSNSSGFMGVGWSLAGTIIIVFLVLGALIVYYFIRRTPRPAPEIAGGAEAVSNVATVTPVRSSQAVVANAIEPNYNSEKSTKVDWDDILPRDGKKVQPFKTRLEITGGKIVIAGDGQSTDIEIINNPDSRVIISMEYDPELHPRGLAKIITLGSVSESENKRRL